MRQLKDQKYVEIGYHNNDNNNSPNNEKNTCEVMSPSPDDLQSLLGIPSLVEYATIRIFLCT